MFLRRFMDFPSFVISIFDTLTQYWKLTSLHTICVAFSVDHTQNFVEFWLVFDPQSNWVESFERSLISSDTSDPFQQNLTNSIKVEANWHEFHFRFIHSPISVQTRMCDE